MGDGRARCSEPNRDGRSLRMAVARDAQGRHPGTTALVGSDPYEMTGSLLACGAARVAQPDAILEPGAHRPVAAFGLDARRLGAAEAGVHEVDGATVRRR
ncbi:hypothetical protein OHQ89_47630 [Streptomyces canus]|uniref:hypothetical protein n=1 Tax=Streptomyces canus TaxID=58343 RepID=UPI0030E2FB6C